MILAIHIGNSNLTIGGVEAGELRFVGRLTTESRTEDEFAAALQGLLQLYGVEQKPAGAIIASVVPPLTQPVCAAAARLTGRRPLVVGPGVKTGLNIAIENPNQLGSDLVVAAAAAAARYPLPLVVVALGTATTFSVVDAHRSFRGGIIAPGVRVGHDALIERAIGADIDSARPAEDHLDAKSRLQGILQSGGRMPVYELIERSGPDHMPLFRFRVSADGEALGEGAGHSKQQAQIAAAEAALARLRAGA